MCRQPKLLNRLAGLVSVAVAMQAYAKGFVRLVRAAKPLSRAGYSWFLIMYFVPAVGISHAGGKCKAYNKAAAVGPLLEVTYER